MRRTTVFIIITVVSLASLAGFWIYIITLPAAMHSSMPSSMQGMMDAVMGGGMMASPTPFFTVLFAIQFVFVAVLALGIIGLAYSSLLPEIRNIPIVPPKPQASLDAIMKTLTAEEQKVVEVIMVHDGRYLQKYIVKESGLTRLKVHRILARLAERGIVTIREYANTNEVAVAEWLQKEKEGA